MANRDIRSTDDPFDKLVVCLSKTGASLAAPVVVNPQGVGLKDSARKFPTPWRIAKKIFGGGRIDEYHPTDRRTSPGWVAGMFMLFPSTIFQELGGFDERFYLSYEDVDICARLRLARWDIALCIDTGSLMSPAARGIRI